jgi:LmbE family N-acetylglucosaminyl deacetylase
MTAMLRLGFENVQSVLCLGAHADDIEIGCGGTLLRLLAENPKLTVYWAVLSAAGPRAEEVRTAAGRLLGPAGVDRVSLGQFRDSFFPYEGPAIKEFVHQLAEQSRPDLVFTHRRDDRHQDHRVVAELTWQALRDQVILEYEIPKYEGDLGHPNLYVPLEQQICQSKVELTCECYVSQRSKAWFTPDTLWATLRLRGLECQSPTRFAEAFHASKLVW